MATLWHQFDATQKLTPLRYQRQPSIFSSAFYRLLLLASLGLAIALLLIMFGLLNKSGILWDSPTKANATPQQMEGQGTDGLKSLKTGKTHTNGGAGSLPENGTRNMKVMKAALTVLNQGGI